MKIVWIALVFSVISSNVFARSHYCIQVTTLYNFDKYRIPRDIKSILNHYDKARVDKKNGRLVLRVGDYNEYEDAEDDLMKIQDTFYDAYIRKCDYRSSDVVYAKNSGRDISMSDGYQMQSSYALERLRDGDEDRYEDESVSHVRKNIRYKGQDRENYDLYMECQKCFIPIEESSTHHTSSSSRRKKSYESHSRSHSTEPDDGFDGYDDYPMSDEVDGMKHKTIDKARDHYNSSKKHSEEDEESGGFLDFLKKPQYKHTKYPEEEMKKQEDKAGFFDYLKHNKYEDDDTSSQHKNVKEESKSKSHNFFGYFKGDDSKDEYADEYDKEISGDNVYDMYGIEDKKSKQEHHKSYKQPHTERSYKDHRYENTRDDGAYHEKSRYEREYQRRKVREEHDDYEDDY